MDEGVGDVRVRRLRSSHCETALFELQSSIFESLRVSS